MISYLPRVYLYDNFLTNEECEHLISRGSGLLSESKVVSSSGADNSALCNLRQSQSAFLPVGCDDVLSRIEARIHGIAGLPVENGEPMQILFYRGGSDDKFLPHYDGVARNTDGYEAYHSRGGERIVTILMYLSTPEEGGETVFPRVGIEVKPRMGRAVLFYNVTADHELDPQSLHGGKAVVAGDKWCATKWIRQSKFV
eukprot:Rmarinus@m.413